MTIFLFALPATNPIMIVIVFLPYLIGGLVLFALSKFPAELVCFDLDKSYEQK
jgi:hypothetical protein